MWKFSSVYFVCSYFGDYTFTWFMKLLKPKRRRIFFLFVLFVQLLNCSLIGFCFQKFFIFVLVLFLSFNILIVFNRCFNFILKGAQIRVYWTVAKSRLSKWRLYVAPSIPKKFFIFRVPLNCQIWGSLEPQTWIYLEIVFVLKI